jgi:RND family efflux transporter MFP subunit
MPTMAMRGASGTARKLGDGRYAFDLPIGWATTWAVTIRAEGGVSGNATFHFVVAGASSEAMGGESSSGEIGPWRTGALILCVLIVLAAVLLVWGERRMIGALVVLGVAALVVVGVAIVQAYAASQPGSMSGMDMSSMNDVRGEAPPTVTTAAVSRVSGITKSVVVAPGTLAPYLVQDIVTRAPGILRDFSAYAGDRVRAGQTLALLDEPELAARAGASAADARAQAAAAEASMIEAMHHAPNGVRVAREDLAAKSERQRYWSAELRRERSLLDAGAVSRQEYEDERAQAAAAEADLASARIKLGDADASVTMATAQAESQHAQAQRAADAARADAVMLDYTKVVAPFDGVVLKRLVDPGTVVQAGTTIARVAVLDRLRVQANVAQEDLATIALGTPIEVRLDGSSTRTLRGRVTSIAPVADATTHTASVEAIVENPGFVVPGGYVRVVLHGRARTPDDALCVPSDAVVGASENGNAVWTITDGSAHRVSVALLADDGKTATVRADALHAGDRVAVDGSDSLEEGERVAERGEAAR